MGEAEEVRVSQGGGLLLGGVRDRADAARKPLIRRCVDASLERLAPALVGELDLLDCQHGRRCS